MNTDIKMTREEYIAGPMTEMVRLAVEHAKKTEREACAKVCDAYGQMGLGANSAANAIRAMGNT